MIVVDGHCDVLWRLWEDPERSFSDGTLQAGAERLAAGNVRAQVFALFVPPQVPRGQRLKAALAMVDRWHGEVVENAGFRPLLWRDDVPRVTGGDRPWALLALEGAEALEGELVHLRVLYHLGLRMVGLTWNEANEAADGCGEARGGGLTRFGRSLVEEINRLSLLLDVAHLSERGFWEAAEHYDGPLVASHANCRAVHDHPRNLTDDQLRAIAESGGVVGLTFVPAFLTGGEATRDDVRRHLEHAVSVAGEDHVAFGSDFDGIDRVVAGLEHAACYAEWADYLLRYYPASSVEKWLFGNWLRVLAARLPARPMTNL
ncbi:MAG TPA: dipeptidase [Calditerricola sp.]